MVAQSARRPGETVEATSKRKKTVETVDERNSRVEAVLAEMLHDVPECPYCKRHPCECPPPVKK